MPFSSASDTSRYTVTLLTILTADPAAGAEIAYTVPAGVRLDIQSLFVQLVTDATVANRTAEVVIDDGTNTIARISPAATQAASLTVNYTFAGNLQNMAAAVNGDVNTSLPAPLTIGPGYRIRTITASKGAADNYGPMTILAVQYS